MLEHEDCLSKRHPLVVNTFSFGKINKIIELNTFFLKRTFQYFFSSRSWIKSHCSKGKVETPPFVLLGFSQPGPVSFSGLITGHWSLSPWSLWPLETVLQFLNMTLSCFWAFAYAASSIWNPLLIFLFCKHLISSRSRSHASPTMKPSLHIYDTFLWNFSSQVWLSVHLSLVPQCMPWCENLLLLIFVPPTHPRYLITA